MGTDSSATIAYGYQLPKKLVDEEDDLEDLLSKEDKHLDFAFGGDSYNEEGKTFIIIAKSEQKIYAWENGGAKTIKLEKLIARDGWDEQLLEFANKHKISKPKIGWYLLVSVL